MFAVVLFFASLMFLAEPNSIGSVWEAIYFCLVAISTVGFGDVVAETVFGRFVTMAMIVAGVLYMAMPLGIIGHAFTAAWVDRERIILVNWVYQAFSAHGYTASDMPILFEIFDTTMDGKLHFRDFTEMVREMSLGLSDERCLVLFRALDIDKNGRLECQEFVRSIFPGSYKDLFGDDHLHSLTNNEVEN
jgi:hypothetical protein